MSLFGFGDRAVAPPGAQLHEDRQSSSTKEEGRVASNLIIYYSDHPKAKSFKSKCNFMRERKKIPPTCYHYSYFFCLKVLRD